MCKILVYPCVNKGFVWFRKNFKVENMILSLLFIGLGFFLIVKILTRKKKAENVVLSEGQVLKNKYIIDHEKKLIDDAVYDEYLDWCKFKGEVAVDKNGFDEHRMKEYHLYKKLLKHGISGI